MFTDIEGSTRLLDSLGDAYGRLLSEHHQLIVDTAERHQGVLVDTQGDACFIVFPTAEQAVGSAAAIQQGLAAHRWPGDAALRVRMGLHTGAPVPMDDRYVGMDVHRAARISAAAHGGQVIASAATAQLAGGDAHTWLELGDFRLKDLDRPERLYQLVATGLARDHPPLKADRWEAELPEPPTLFVGRAAVVEDIITMVSGDTRLVTLIGPGGIGKTRLAVHVGRVWSQRLPDAVDFIPLATMSTPDEIVAALLERVGASQGRPEDHVGLVIGHLRSRRTLLLLDNMEHLLPEAARLVSDLMRGCPGLRIMATSRTPIGVSGEQLVRLPGLAVPPDDTDLDTAYASEAVSLFVDRARGLDPAFQLTKENLGAVVGICRRLDGIPLALELAAARTAVLSPGELLDRLRIDLLTSQSPDLDDRQRTLASTIEWSYRLLDEPLRRAFREFSVFAGGGRLDDVEAVVDPAGGTSALEAVSQLFSHSLLWRDEDEGGTSRFRMLEVVREYAQTELERSGDFDAVADRHANRLAEFLQAAEKLIDGPEASEWLGRVEAEMSNIRAALRWTLEDPRGSAGTGLAIAEALGWFWYIRGHATEGLRWLDAALAVADTAPGTTRIRITYYAGAMAERIGRFSEAVDRFQQTLAICRELGDEIRTGRALNSLGGMAVEMGDLEAATEYLAEADAILLAQDDEYGLGANRINQCDVAVARGDLDQARRLGESALALFADAGNEFGEGVAWRHLAKVAYAEGNLNEARSLLKMALDRGLQIRDQAASARCLERLGGIEIALGNHARGVRLGAAAQRIRTELGDPMTTDGLASFDASWEEAAQALGDLDYQTAWNQGGNMTLDQAIAYAVTD